jgi:undecaprenyl pyrophosphate synthase
VIQMTTQCIINPQEEYLIKKVFDYCMSKDKYSEPIGLECIRKLNVTVLTQPMDNDHGYVENDQEDNRKFTITLASNYDSIREFLGTFVHELVHIYQWICMEHNQMSEEDSESDADYWAEQICDNMWKNNLI